MAPPYMRLLLMKDKIEVLFLSMENKVLITKHCKNGMARTYNGCVNLDDYQVNPGFLNEGPTPKRAAVPLTGGSTYEHATGLGAVDLKIKIDSGLSNIKII